MLLITAAWCRAGAADPAVLVVWTSGVAPFEEALCGLRSSLSGFEAVDLKSPSAESELEQATRRTPRLVVAIGMNALTAVKSRHFSGPVLATMILRSDGAAVLGSAQKTGAIYLDVPLSDVTARLRATFPGKARLGMIRNPARETAIDPQGGRQHGFSIEPRDCGSPELLLKSLLSLKRKADFVLLQPDASLYNEATARPLLMASIENQLPVIGFSASFVRAGAALGVYPDFQDIGAQTGEAARRFLAGAGLLNETPRKLIFAANPGVLRLLGLEYKSTPEFPVTVIK